MFSNKLVRVNSDRAMCVPSDAQMKAKRGKNKEKRNETKSSSVIDVLATCRHHVWML